MNAVATEASISQVFQRIMAQWEAVDSEITTLYTVAQETLGTKTIFEQDPAFETRIAQFKEVLAQLHERVQHPRVIIATTGTTSSGKSTLANFLIGAPLIPKAVQEMSLGVVTVTHSDQERVLIIEDTKNAQWETGSFEIDDGPSGACRWMRKTMDAYREQLEMGVQDVDPPRMQIFWPTRLGRLLKASGLPEGTHVQIDDLPGLKHVSDEKNSGLIKERSKHALCLVAYNSYETDPIKQEALVEQVVEQVKMLGGTPRRMLFILNRFDAFKDDDDPKKSEEKYYETAKAAIQGSLMRELKEHARDIQKIKPLRFSSEPSLYAIMAQEAEGDERSEFLNEIVRNYESLFTREEMRSLPRDERDWSPEQQEWFIRETLTRSYGISFLEVLNVHIRENLPELVLSKTIHDLHDAASAILTQLDAIATAYSENERDKLEKALALVDRTHDKLQNIRKDVVSTLNPIKEATKKKGDLQGELLKVAPAIERELRLKKDALAPIHQFLPALLHNPMNRIQDDVVRIMEGSGQPSSFTQRSSIYSATQNLKNSPYGKDKRWESGGQFPENEKSKLVQIVKAFTSALAKEVSDAIAREAKTQTSRLEGSFDCWAQAIVDEIELRALEEVKDFHLDGVLTGLHIQTQFQPPTITRIEFNPDFTTYTYTERESYTKIITERRRVWYKLFLGKATFTKRIPAYRDLAREGIQLSDLYTLLEGLVQSSTVERTEMELSQWLREAVDSFDKALQSRLAQEFQQYRRALRTRQEELRESAETQIALADNYKEQVREAIKEVSSYRRWQYSI